MKKTLLFAFLLSVFSIAQAQTTATDFTANDCNGISHSLFADLDAGKVIVISFVMPCGSCVSPSLSAYSIAQSYQSSNPGRVVFYIVDDAGNTSCSTINTWANTNNMPNSTRFSTTSFVMSDYGTAGMPKVVVLGGTNHTIFYNSNNTVSTSALKNAIDAGIAATTGVSELVNNFSALSVSPNPVDNLTELSYSIESSSDVKIGMYNILGDNTATIFSGNQCAGDHKVTVDCANLPNGIYFVKLSAGKAEKTINLSVSH